MGVADSVDGSAVTARVTVLVSVSAVPAHSPELNTECVMAEALAANMIVARFAGIEVPVYNAPDAAM